MFVNFGRGIVSSADLCYNEMMMEMDKEKELPKRGDLRLKNYDYSFLGEYFVTICTENRRKILSRFVGVDFCGVAFYINIQAISQQRIWARTYTDAFVIQK